MLINTLEELGETSVRQRDGLPHRLHRGLGGFRALCHICAHIRADVRRQIDRPGHAGGQAGRGVDQVARRVGEGGHRIEHGICVIQFHAQIDQFLAQILQRRLRVEAVGVQYRYHRCRAVRQRLQESRVDGLLHGGLGFPGNFGGDGVFLSVFIVDQRRVLELQRHEAHDVFRKIRRYHQRRVAVSAVNPLQGLFRAFAEYPADLLVRLQALYQLFAYLQLDPEQVRAPVYVRDGHPDSGGGRLAVGIPVGEDIEPGIQARNHAESHQDYQHHHAAENPVRIRIDDFKDVAHAAYFSRFRCLPSVCFSRFPYSLSRRRCSASSRCRRSSRRCSSVSCRSASRVEIRALSSSSI